MHFSPEWDDEQDRHREIGLRLRGRFNMNPFMGVHEPIFPKRYVGHDCTIWAVKTTTAFMQDLAGKVGVKDPIGIHVAKYDPH